MLVADDERYRRPDVQTSRTIQLTQNGLIESEGPLWEAQRSRLMSLFAPDRIAEYAGHDRRGGRGSD